MYEGTYGPHLWLLQNNLTPKHSAAEIGAANRLGLNLD